MFLPELDQNQSMKDDIREAYQKGMPIWAECGGFIYLNDTITGFGGETYSGVGIIPGQVKMYEGLAALGYVQALALEDSIIAKRGDVLRGHEFHYSVVSDLEYKSAFMLTGGKGKDFRLDGYVDGNLSASYVHIHFRSNPDAARCLLQACQEYQQSWKEARA